MMGTFGLRCCGTIPATGWGRRKGKGAHGVQKLVVEDRVDVARDGRFSGAHGPGRCAVHRPAQGHDEQERDEPEEGCPCEGHQRPRAITQGPTAAAPPLAPPGIDSPPPARPAGRVPLAASHPLAPNAGALPALHRQCVDGLKEGGAAHTYPLPKRELRVTLGRRAAAAAAFAGRERDDVAHLLLQLITPRGVCAIGVCPGCVKRSAHKARRVRLVERARGVQQIGGTEVVGRRHAAPRVQAVVRLDAEELLA
eukprot:scaffold4498_cov119-Isochrysis_galbana.AAC.55